MSDSRLIDDIVGLRVTSDGIVQQDEDQQENVTAMNTDVITEMRETIMSMKMVMEAQDRRIAQMEIVIERLKMNSNPDRIRHRATMPLPYAMKHTTSPIFNKNLYKGRELIGDMVRQAD
jgi:hypothetical protein